jgi:hypothetical protein
MAEDPNASMRAISIAVRGFGAFALPTKRFLGEDGLKVGVVLCVCVCVCVGFFFRLLVWCAGISQTSSTTLHLIQLHLSPLYMRTLVALFLSLSCSLYLSCSLSLSFSLHLPTGNASQTLPV